MDLECDICHSSIGEEAQPPAYQGTKASAGPSSSKEEITVELCCTPCGHLFHDACIRDWLTIESTCPYCMEPVFVLDLKPTFIPKVLSESSVVVNSETPISTAAKGQMSILVKAILELQTTEMKAERTKTLKMEEENKTLMERIAALQTELEAEKEKVRDEHAKRTELHRKFTAEKVREERDAALYRQLEAEKVREKRDAALQRERQVGHIWEQRNEALDKQLNVERNAALQSQLAEEEFWKGRNAGLERKLEEERNAALRRQADAENLWEERYAALQRKLTEERNAAVERQRDVEEVWEQWNLQLQRQLEAEKVRETEKFWEERNAELQRQLVDERSAALRRQIDAETFWKEQNAELQGQLEEAKKNVRDEWNTVLQGQLKLEVDEIEKPRRGAGDGGWLKKKFFG